MEGMPMSFVVRAVISLLAGVGAGLLGFWAVWVAVGGSAWRHPGVGYDNWLVAGIFIPGVLVPLAVFSTISKWAGPVTAEA
jgi:hypothetical protein